MAEHGVATISTSTAGAGVRTCAADLPCARHQSVFDAAMAPTQESGLRENCTSRLSERAEAGRKPTSPDSTAMKPANKANEPTAEASTGANAAEPVERRAGAKGNAHQQSTHWTQSQARVSQALERIRQAIAVIHPRWEKLWVGAAEAMAPSSSIRTDGDCPVLQVNDLSRSLDAFDPISTLVVVVEMSKTRWLVSGVVPGVERQPLKKLEPDATALLRLIERWRIEAVRAGRPISRIALAYEAGRDGFWLARWLIARGI